MGKRRTNKIRKKNTKRRTYKKRSYKRKYRKSNRKLKGGLEPIKNFPFFPWNPSSQERLEVDIELRKLIEILTGSVPEMILKKLDFPIYVPFAPNEPPIFTVDKEQKILFLIEYVPFQLNFQKVGDIFKSQPIIKFEIENMIETSQSLTSDKIISLFAKNQKVQSGGFGLSDVKNKVMGAFGVGRRAAAAAPDAVANAARGAAGAAGRGARAAMGAARTVGRAITHPVKSVIGLIQYIFKMLKDKIRSGRFYFSLYVTEDNNGVYSLVLEARNNNTTRNCVLFKSQLDPNRPQTDIQNVEELLDDSPLENEQPPPEQPPQAPDAAFSEAQDVAEIMPDQTSSETQDPEVIQAVQAAQGNRVNEAQREAIRTRCLERRKCESQMIGKQRCRNKCNKEAFNQV